MNYVPEVNDETLEKSFKTAESQKENTVHNWACHKCSGLIIKDYCQYNPIYKAKNKALKYKTVFYSKKA